MLTKEQIKSASDRPREFVPVPEWCPAGETFDPSKHGVYVGTMSGRQRDRFEARIVADRDSGNSDWRALLAVYAVQDAEGKPLFTDADIEWLGDKGYSALQPIFDAAVRLNKLSQTDQQELVKNS
jgi:hypothetical protein